MTIRCVPLLAALVAALLATGASARELTLRFAGQIFNGPLTGYEFAATCTYDGDGDRLTQRGKCRLTATRAADGQQLKIDDSQARLAVAADRRRLQVTLGPDIGPPGAKANDKLAAFSANFQFDQPVTLVDPFPRFVAASVSLMGPVIICNDECLIYEMVGTS